MTPAKTYVVSELNTAQNIDTPARRKRFLVIIFRAVIFYKWEWLLKYEIFYICPLERFMNTFSKCSYRQQDRPFRAWNALTKTFTPKSRTEQGRGENLSDVHQNSVKFECYSPITPRFPWQQFFGLRIATVLF